MTEQGAVILVLVLLIGGLLAAISGKAVRIVPQAHAGLVERLGRYRRTIEPGVNLVAPIIDQVCLVDTRDQELDLPAMQTSTSDGTALTIEAQLRYRITDPVKATYEIADHRDALAQIATHALSYLEPGRTLYEVQNNHRELADLLRGAIANGARRFGVEPADFEIRSVRPSAAS